MKITFKLLIITGLLFVFSACTSDSDEQQVSQEVSFAFGQNQLQKAINSEDINGVFVSVEDASGNTVVNLERLSLVQFGDQYVSEKIELTTGEYSVTDFLVVSNIDSVTWITPKEGSEFANLVLDPLPVNFNVSAGDETLVPLEVIPANLGDPIDYGYASFVINFVNTLNVGLQIYFPFDSIIENYGELDIPYYVHNIDLMDKSKVFTDGSVLFNGYDSYINLNDDQPVITGTTFTIASWIKLNGQGGSTWPRNIIFEQRDDEASGDYAKSTIVLCAENKTGMVHFVLRSSEQDMADIKYPGLSYNEWHHYTAVLDDEKNLKMYIDGFLVKDTVYNFTGDFNTSIDHVDIGVQEYWGINQGALNGEMNEFRLYNRALTDREILSLSDVE